MANVRDLLKDKLQVDHVTQLIRCNNGECQMMGSSICCEQGHGESPTYLLTTLYLRLIAKAWLFPAVGVTDELPGGSDTLGDGRILILMG